MRRAPLVLVPAALALLALPIAPAAAAPPERLPAQEPLTGLPFCGTTVSIAEVVNRTKINSRDLVTGALRLRLTNERTGQSAVVNVSGPATLTEAVDGSRVTVTFVGKGRSLIFPLDAEELAAFRAAGLPDLAVTSGPVRVVLRLDTAGADEDTPPKFLGVTVDAPHRLVDACDLIT